MTAEDFVERLRVQCAAIGFDLDKAGSSLVERVRLLAEHSRTCDDASRMSSYADRIFRHYDIAKPRETFNALERQTVVLGCLFSDIGKTGPADADADARRLIAEIFAVENVQDDKQPVATFLRTYFAADAEQRIARFRALELDPEMSIRQFWNLHSSWTLAIAEAARLPPEAVAAAATHHLLDDVNPQAIVGEDDRFTRRFGENAAFDRAEKLVIILDKYDAARRRGGRTHEQAILWLRDRIAKSPRFRDDQEFHDLLADVDTVLGSPKAEKDERPELAELRARLHATTDEARPEAVLRRKQTGQRTARENIADLVDEGSFIEYGALALAAQRQRRPLDELVKVSPADGLVCGIGTVNRASFDDERARTMVIAYDYTVFAGTQGLMSHKKLDRMLSLAAEWRLPVVLFAEGGGGRPNDTDAQTVAGLDTPSFFAFAALSGLAPRVGIASGRCFAGNAALLGCCDVVIATEDSSIGMGGPAMIEGGGLGKFEPGEVGPIDMQTKNGVVDVRAKGEAEATRVAKKYLGYFQGPLTTWEHADQAVLRAAMPESRRRAYKIRPILETVVDTGSMLELRRDFGRSTVTALARIEGRAVGLVANDTFHLGGAVDADGADKAARFMQLCDAFALPIVSFCDTPGFMVGPKAETTALVRHVSRMFVTAASLSVPMFTVVLRKGYGLGAQAMAGGHFHAPFFTVSWPTGEFGGMGLEGAVRLGLRKELAAVGDDKQREEMFQAAVAIAYERGKAINMASLLEIDGVIDPADTRTWIVRGLRSASMKERKRRFIDTW